MIVSDLGDAPRIWMNVTTSSRWTRPAMGIVRVEQELVKELGRLYGDRFALCVLKDGALVPFYSDTQDESVETAYFWPDHSRRVPGGSAVEFSSGGKTIRAVSMDRAGSYGSANGNRTPPGERSIGLGDIVISIGLDWDTGVIDLFLEMKRRIGIRLITCCYDLIPILFPQWCVGEVAVRFEQYFTKLAWCSDLILCISQQSKKDYLALAERLGFPPVPTTVIPLGDNVGPDRAADKNSLQGISTDVAQTLNDAFILCVGTIERRKNHEILYRAYHLLARAGKLDDVPRLVFVGMHGWGVHDLLNDMALDPLMRDKIVQLHHVSDTELSLLYEKAAFIVYPSFYEGWGLPVGEALALGKVVVASDQGAIPEVGGNLVLYADPWNPRDWADTIHGLSVAPDRLERRRMKVIDEYHNRNWTDTALAARAAIDTMAGQSLARATTLYPGYDMNTGVGLACGGTVMSTGQAGPLIYGPYLGIRRGVYDIEILYDKLAGASGNCRASVVSNGGQTTYAALDRQFGVEADMSASLLMSGVIFDNDVLDYEVTLYIDETLMISVSRVDVRPVFQQRQKLLAPEREVQ